MEEVMQNMPKIEVRKVVEFTGDAQIPVVGEVVEDVADEDLEELAVCAVVEGPGGPRTEVLGVFLSYQAIVCRNLLHKLFRPGMTDAPVVIIGPCEHDPRTGRHELVDELKDGSEWGVFRTRDPEILEVFAFYREAAEALGAVQRYRNLVAFSLAEMRAAVQMMQWVVTSMFTTEQEPEIGPKLIELVRRVGHQAFRDIVVGLAPVHAEAQAIGMRANGITDYNRSHDNTWTACFFAFLTEISETGIRVEPDWKEQAVHYWAQFKDEMEKGIHPDFE